ncbi:MAG: ABC transporter permease [Anaerolineae bacterium]|nr:ABC transporter permease [Anaerolineae bacterium]
MSLLPLYRTAWRRIRRRPLQYLLFILGVAIGVAMMVSIDLANGSAQRAFQLSTDAVTGKTTHRLVAGSVGLDEAIYTRLRRELGYTQSAPVVEGYVRVPEMGEQPYRLLGIDPFAEPPFRTYLGQDLRNEALTPFLAQANSVILSTDLAARFGLELGDSLTLDNSGVLTQAVIVALVSPGDGNEARAMGSLIFTDVATAQEVLALPGRLSHIDLILNDDAPLMAIEAILPEGVRVELAAARGNAIQQMSAAFTLNLTALSLLALVVGMFLIYNTVTFSVIQRRPLFGVLRCLGVTGGQLFTLILGEAFLLSLIGSILGVGLGVVLGQGMVRLVTQTINDFYFVVTVQEVAVPAAALVKGVLIGVAAALLASLMPAIEAMRTAPTSNLQRSALESKTRRFIPWLLAAWAVLVVIGSFLLALRGVSLIITFAGLFTVLIAFALLTAPVTMWLMERVAPLVGALFGPIGRMAPRDIVRSLSRTSVAIAALMTAVSVIVGVSIMIGSFRQTVVTWLDSTLQADLFISPPTLTASRNVGTLQPEVIAIASGWPGVAATATVRSVMVNVPDLGRDVELRAVAGDVTRGGRQYAWTDNQPDLWARFIAGEGVMLSEPLLLKENLDTPPPPITLVTDQGPQTFPVLAVYYDYSSDQGSLMIGDPLYRQWWADEAVSSMALLVVDGVDVDAMVLALQAELAPVQELSISSNQGIRQGSLEIFDRTFAITAALRLLATMVAFIGVLSALLSLQLERTRELGVLRATGMSLRQMWQMVLLETGLMGTLAGLLAMPTGYVLAWILIYIINVRSFGWTLMMDLRPQYFLQALMVAVVSALLAGIYPSLRLGNMVVASAIRQE